MFAIIDDITPDRATVTETFESLTALRDEWYDATPTGPREHQQAVKCPEGTKVGERIWLSAVEPVVLD